MFSWTPCESIHVLHRRAMRSNETVAPFFFFFLHDTLARYVMHLLENFNANATVCFAADMKGHSGQVET